MLITRSFKNEYTKEAKILNVIENEIKNITSVINKFNLNENEDVEIRILVNGSNRNKRVVSKIEANLVKNSD